MTFEIGQLTVQPVAPALPAPAPIAPAHPIEALAAAPASPDVDTSDLIPASPPPEVLAEVDAAFARAAQLAADNRELHFTRDEQTGRMIIEVRTLDGEVLKTIPPSATFNVMAGGTL